MQSIRYILAVALLAALVACSKEDGDSVPTDARGEIEVGISFLVPDSPDGDGVSTRLTGAQESAVNEVRVVWFDQSGTFVHYAVGLDPDVSGSVHSCRVLMNEGVYDIMVLANSAEWFEAVYPSGIPAGTTLEAFAAAIVAECTGVMTWSGNTVPMWGMKETVTVSKTSYQVSGITLTRALVRVDVKVDPSVTASRFELEAVTVYRNYRKGRLVPVLASDHWNNTTDTALKPSLPTGADLVNNDGRAFPATAGEVANSIYFFETPAGEDLSMAVNDRNPCLIVRGKYNGGASSYYRIDFTKNSSTFAEYIDLLRNNVYEVVIQQVDRDGAASEADALKGRPANITYNISEFNKSGMTNIAWDGQHYLMASADSLTYWSGASSAALRIQTNHLSGWKVADAPAWITVTPDRSEYTAESTVEVAATAYSGSSPRTGKLVLVAGELELTVEITQSNLEELSLYLDTNTIIFYAEGGSHTVTSSGLPVVSASGTSLSIDYIGDISFVSPPAVATTPTFTLTASANTGGNLLTGVVTVSKTLNDRTVRQEIAVRQYPGTNPFAITTDSPYPAIAQTDATIWVTCAQDWYLKRSVPSGAASISGIQAGAASPRECNLSIAANESYTDREITLLFSTADDMYEYEVTVTQEGAVPYFFFYNLLMDDLYEHTFTGTTATTVNVGFDLNFPWRFSETGMGGIVAGVTHQPGTLYPVEDITQGKQETISFTSIDYTNRTGMPAAGTVQSAEAYIYSENTAPYPSALYGTIKLNRVIPSVIDYVGSSISPAVGTIPREGGTISVTAGSNDQWSISATSAVGSPVAPKGTQYEVNTLSVDIPANNGFGDGKEIEVFYTHDGQQVKAATYIQEEYTILATDLTGTKSQLSYPYLLVGYGDVLSGKIKGNYPDVYLAVRRDNTTYSSKFFPAGIEDEFSFDIPSNPTTGEYEWVLCYSTDALNWTVLNTLKQYPPNYLYNRLFYGLENYRESSIDKMLTWAEAMGVDPYYNDQTHYNTWENVLRENYGYTPTHNTGCNAYTDIGMTTRDFILPRSFEVEEMLRVQVSGAYDFGITEGMKFHSSYDGGMDISRIYWLENGRIEYTESPGNKNVPAYVRCVTRFE